MIQNKQKIEETRKNNVELFTIVFKSIFSLHFIKALMSSFAYYLFEHVYWRFNITTAKHVRIHSSVSIRNAENISIDYDTRITKGVIIWAGKYSKITMGKNVLVGPYVQFHATNHGYVLGDGPMTYQNRSEKDIFIGNDVWIGGGSIILSGVTLADGIIVAANSTVTKNFTEKNIIIGGVPARIIKKRD